MRTKRTAANSTDSRSTSVADVPFTYGTVRIQVDVWKKPVADVTPQDSHAADHVMASTATAAWSQIDGLNALIAARSDLTAVDNNDYTASRSLTIGNMTVCARLSFRLNVGVPTYIIHPVSEIILGETMACVLHIVDPNMTQVMKRDTMDMTAQMMGGFASMAFRILTDPDLFREPSSGSSSAKTGDEEPVAESKEA